MAGNAFGLTVTVMFRPPNNPYIAEKVFSFRAARMGKLVPSHAGSSFALGATTEAGRAGIGVLVDQKFQKGLSTDFFGQPVQTNPLLAKLVRQFDCEVYPARCIRLPNNRYRLEIETEDRHSAQRQGRGRCAGHRPASQRQGGKLGARASRAMALVSRPLEHQA